MKEPKLQGTYRQMEDHLQINIRQVWRGLQAISGKMEEPGVRLKANKLNLHNRFDTVPTSVR